MHLALGTKERAAPAPVLDPVPDLAATSRQIAYRSKGRTRGGVNRLASPGDIGQLVKPFVFLDLFALASERHRMGMHPHSGIATVTVLLEGALAYRETTGSEGVLPTGGVEFMSAGGGVWHAGGPADSGTVKGFQLWLALAPEDENGPAHSRYLAPEEIASHGPARVIIGEYGGARSALQARASINYLHVRLRDGERWRYQPPAAHDVAWVALAGGALDLAGERIGQEIAVFEDGSGQLDFTAHGDTEFVLGSATRHPHELVTGYYSVHTTAAALEQGEREIQRIGSHLRAAGQL